MQLYNIDHPSKNDHTALKHNGSSTTGIDKQHVTLDDDGNKDQAVQVPVRNRGALERFRQRTSRTFARANEKCHIDPKFGVEQQLNASPLLISQNPEQTAATTWWKRLRSLVPLAGLAVN
jgi:hypothetical protein